MIAAGGVTVRAGAATLLDGVSVELRSGRLTAVLGPNGAGKSTLLDCLAGARRPDAGNVAIAGRSLDGWAARDLARIRAVLPQSTRLAFDLGVVEVVALGRQPFFGTPDMRHDRVAIEDALRRLDLGAMRHRAVPGLSGGEQQRVHMARALAQLWRPPGDPAPRALLLDEPTSALDLRHRRTVLSLAREEARRGAAVLAVLHDLTLAADYADDVVLLRGGRLLAAGPAAEVLTPERLGACFEVPVQRLQRADGSAVFVA